jgi:hypothetical protein
VDVIVNGTQVKVITTRTRRALHSVRRPAPDPGTPPIGSDVHQGTPSKRAPADLKKDAGGFDLPIALGLLSGSGQAAFDRPGTFSIVGELALTGETQLVKGVLAMALQAAAKKRTGILEPVIDFYRGFPGICGVNQP